MPPRRTINVPGHHHFVTFSTYLRRRFLDSEKTRNIVMEALQRCLETHQTECSGFVIMPNHVHALLSGEASFSIEKFMQTWKKTSSYRLKRFYADEIETYWQLCPKESPVWQAGFYDFNVESDEKHLEKLTYMHNNPVEARLVPTDVEWEWSSARFYERGECVGVTITP